MGGYERESKPAFLPDGTEGLDRIPADFNGRLLEDDWERFEEITENSKRRVPAMDEVRITKLINGPEAFTPDNEFCLGESEVRGLLRRRRVLRPRARRRGWDRPGDRRVDRRGRAEPRPLGDGRPSLRRPSTARPPTPTPGSVRPTRPTTTSATRTTSGRPGGRCGSRRPTRWHADHGAAFGEKSGWERVNWYESNAADGRRGVAPAGLGGPPLVAGDRRRAPRHPRARRPLRRDLVREDGDRGPRRGGAARAPLRQPGRPRRRPDHLHADAQPPRRDRVRLHGRPARRGAASRSSPGPRSGTTTASGSESTCRRSGTTRVRDVTSAWACFGIWGPRARDVLAPLTPADLSNDAFPYMSVREITVGDVPGPRAAGHLRRRARLGDLLPDRVRARPLANAVGGGRAARDRRRRLPGDRLDAAREGLPSLGRRHHPRRDPVRGRGRLLRQARQGGRIHRPRRARRGQGDEARGRSWCASLSRTRARSRSATSRCASSARSPGA